MVNALRTLSEAGGNVAHAQLRAEAISMNENETGAGLVAVMEREIRYNAPGGKVQIFRGWRDQMVLSYHSDQLFHVIDLNNGP